MTGGGPIVELNPKPKKILNFVRPTKIHAQTFGTLNIQCFPSVTVRVPDTMIALSSPLSSGMEVLEFLFDNDFHPGFHRVSLDSLSLSKADVFSFFVTGSSTCSSTSTLEWNRDEHPQYLHLADTLCFHSHRLKQTTNTVQGMILYIFP